MTAEGSCAKVLIGLLLIVVVLAVFAWRQKNY